MNYKTLLKNRRFPGIPMRAEICPGPSIFLDRGTQHSMLKDSFNPKNAWPLGGGNDPCWRGACFKIYAGNSGRHESKIYNYVVNQLNYKLYIYIFFIFII